MPAKQKVILAPKNIRGLTNEVYAEIRKFRKLTHNYIPLEDVDQCELTLGKLQCFGNTKCYICSLSLPPHTSIFRSQCMNEFNENLMPYYDFPWVKESCTIDNIYPQCEHVLPCNPRPDATAGSITINPWLLNIMMYSHLKKWFIYLNQHLILPNNATLDRRFVSDQIDLQVSTMPNIQHRRELIFISILVRINYAWAHRLCNIKKSNLDFFDVNFDGTLKIIDAEVVSFIRAFTSNAKDSNVINKIYNNMVEIYNRKKIPTIDLGLFNPVLPISNNVPDPNFDRFQVKMYDSIIERFNILIVAINYDADFYPSELSSFDEEPPKKGGSGSQSLKEIIDSDKDLLKDDETYLFLKYIEDIKDKDGYEETVLELNELFKDTDDKEMDKILHYLKLKLPNADKYINNGLLDKIIELKKLPAYKTLIKFLLFDYSIYDNDEKLSMKYYKDNIYDKYNEDQLKTNYIKIIGLNNKKLIENKKFTGFFDRIFNETDKETILLHSYVVWFIKSIFGNHFDINHYNDMCLLFFKLSILTEILHKSFKSEKIIEDLKIKYATSAKDTGKKQSARLIKSLNDISNRSSSSSKIQPLNIKLQPLRQQSELKVLNPIPIPIQSPNLIIKSISDNKKPISKDDIEYIKNMGNQITDKSYPILTEKQIKNLKKIIRKFEENPNLISDNNLDTHIRKIKRAIKKNLEKIGN